MRKNKVHLYRKTSTNKYRSKDRNRKTTISKWPRQRSQWMLRPLDERFWTQDSHIISEHHSTNYLVIVKGRCAFIVRLNLVQSFFPCLLVIQVSSNAHILGLFFCCLVCILLITLYKFLYTLDIVIQMSLQSLWPACVPLLANLYILPCPLDCTYSHLRFLLKAGFYWACFSKDNSEHWH